MRRQRREMMETLAITSVICIVCACITAICKRQSIVLWQFLGVAFVAYAALTMTRSLAGLLALPLAPSWLMILTAVGGTAAMFYATPAPESPDVVHQPASVANRSRYDGTGSAGG
jgi:hypothetical protein